MALTQISTEGIKNGTITNADLASNAAIDGSKISPDFGSQAISTTNDSVTIGDSIIHSGDTDTKIRFPTANKISFEAGGSTRFQTTSTGAQIDTILILNGAAGNPGRLRLQEGGALCEIAGVRNTDSSSFLYFKTEIGGSVDTRVVIDGGGHLRPFADSTYDLGITGTRWRNVYADTLYGDGSNITAVNADTVDGLNASSFLRSDASDSYNCVGNALAFDFDTNQRNSIIFTLNGSTYWQFLHDNGGQDLNIDRVAGGGSLKVDGSRILSTADEGSGQGLDSDTVDGIEASQFLRKDTTSTFNCNGNVLNFDFDNVGRNSLAFTLNGSTYWQFVHDNGGQDLNIDRNAGSGIVKIDGNKVFHAGNDGSGSGLDADTLDGVQGTSFLRSDAADTASGNLTFNGVVAATNDGSTPDKIGNYKICRVNGAISSIDNLDSFLLSKIDGSYTGGTKPSGSHNGVGIISMQTHTGNYFSQLGLSTNTSDLFIRSANGTTSFDSWQRLAKTSTGNIIGYSPNFPAGSAENIKDAVSGTPDNGWYWIQQFGNVARLHYCAFKDKNGSDIAGGPWTMNWVAGVHPNQFSTTGSTALSQYMNLCKGIGIDKAGRGMESSRTTSQVYGAWLAVKRALWDLDPGFFNGASSGSGGVLTMPIMNINGEGGSSDHRLVYSTGTSTHIPPNQDGDHCNQNQLFCGWWGGNDFSSWATDNNSVPSPEDWGPGDAPHTGDIGAKSNSTQQKPSWKDMMLITCIYK